MIDFLLWVWKLTKECRNLAIYQICWLIENWKNWNIFDLFFFEFFSESNIYLSNFQQINFWTLDFSCTGSYEITLIRLSVPLSLSFLKITSLAFSDIVSGDGWFSDWQNQIFAKEKERNWRPEFRPNEPKSDPKSGPTSGPTVFMPKIIFCHFHKFGLLVFLEIAYNDSWQ